MASLFREFSETYKEFLEKFPNHPLGEEVRSRIMSGRYPSDQWLRAYTTKMKDLMVPLWRRRDHRES